MRYYIVEHETRGCFVEKDLESTKEWPYTKAKFRFSWSCLRTDDKVCKFVSEEKAQAVAAAVKGAYVLVVETKPKFDIRRVITRRTG